MPPPCVRGARGWFWGLGPVPGVVSPPFPPSRLACPALCVAGRPVRVSLTLARWYAIPRGLCVPRRWSSCPSGSPRVPFVCLCARAPAASARPPPFPWGVWRARPRVLPRSLAPFGVLGGGRPGLGSPLPGLGLCTPRGVCLRIRGVPVSGGGVGLGGAARAPRPPFVRPGGGSGAGGRSASFCPSAFPGQATKRMSLALSWSWRAWPPYRSVLCSPTFSGRGPCGVLARWREFAFSPRFLWEPAAGAGGWAVLWPLSRAPQSCQGRGGITPSASGGGEGRCPRGLPAGRGAGRGARGPLAPPLGGGPRFPTLPPLSSSVQSPPASAFGRGREAAPCTGCGLPGRGGGGGGAARGPLPRGPLQTRDLPLPSPSGQHCACHGRCSGNGERGPNTVLVRRRVPPLGVVRAPLRRAGAGSCISRDPRVPVPSGGGGASPWLREGGGSALLQPSSRGRGEGEGALRRPPPPRPIWCRPAILRLRRAPPGYTRAVGVAGRPWASGAARSAANGSVRRGGGEGGGE